MAMMTGGRRPKDDVPSLGDLPWGSMSGEESLEGTIRNDLESLGRKCAQTESGTVETSIVFTVLDFGLATTTGTAAVVTSLAGAKEYCEKPAQGGSAGTCELDAVEHIATVACKSMTPLTVLCLVQHISTAWNSETRSPWFAGASAAERASWTHCISAWLHASVLQLLKLGRDSGLDAHLPEVTKAAKAAIQSIDSYVRALGGTSNDSIDAVVRRTLTLVESLDA